MDMKYLRSLRKDLLSLIMSDNLNEKNEHYVGHRTRLRERFIKSPESLAEYELLELVLSYAIPRKDVKPLAKELISHFKGFDEVFAASVPELVEVNGIKENTAALIKAIYETGIRTLKTKIVKKSVLSKWTEILDFCRLKIGRKKEEVILLLWLNKQLEIIEEELHQQGTVDSTTIYPKEITKRALALRASYLIMAHNHPSGKLKPSQEDIDTTFDVKNALGIMGITLYDHLIVSKESYYSFKEKGLL